MSEGKKQITFPFSTYDFFGYIYPSAAVVAGMYAVDYITAGALKGAKLPATVPFHDMASAVVIYVSAIRSVPVETALVLAGVFVAYVMGHMIAALSSLFAERIFLRNVYGYPYKRLLFTQKSDVMEPRSAFYISVYSLPTFALLTVPAALIHDDGVWPLVPKWLFALTVLLLSVKLSLSLAVSLFIRVKGGVPNVVES